ncbi:hypothetical protein C6499_07735 [Candidatus Poribacteria bacterium]|nr:MAG: hypothetical protein C6499_07735 [Candidatus Poribacteria bacterium]
MPMKVIVSVGIVLGLLITSATAQVQIPAEKLEEVLVLTPEQQAKNIEICTQNLIALGKSIQVYLKEEGDYPEWLSDLYHPKYLPNPDVLICPADRLGGRALFTPNIDPKMPVSYGYQFRPAYRRKKTEERLMFGDVVPLIRCRHHPNLGLPCLNLSFAFKISRSLSRWEDAPEQLYETPEQTIAALEAGLERQPHHERLSYYVYPSLARLYIKTGQKEKVEDLIKLLKSTMNPNSARDNFTLGTLLGLMDRNEEALQLFKKFEGQTPNDHNVHQKLAEIHEKLGNAELAKEHQQKAEPVPVLIGNHKPALALGKPVPNFTATDLDGKPISLEEYRGKVVLLDFWAVWCGPCIAEMPNVKKVYDTYKDEGFDIIGISLDTNEDRLRDYLKENDIPWRQVFSGKGWQSPIAQQYGIRAIPAPWLIDRDGTLISQEARGKALEQLVVDALKG